MAQRHPMFPTEADCAQPLRLLAIDHEDLAVMSAHLQDALVRVRDMVFLPSRRRFAVMANRFDWCAADAGRTERRRCGLHFEGVMKVVCQGFRQDKRDCLLNLLSISFEETDAPAGTVTLTFSAGAAVRLEVECLEAQMRDIGPSWRVQHKPGHDFDDLGAGR